MVVITIISVIVIIVAIRNISPIIGTAFQFVTTGGPADSTVSQTVADLETATVGPEGVKCSAAVQCSAALQCSVSAVQCSAVQCRWGWRAW